MPLLVQSSQNSFSRQVTSSDEKIELRQQPARKATKSANVLPLQHSQLMSMILTVMNFLDKLLVVFDSLRTAFQTSSTQSKQVLLLNVTISRSLGQSIKLIIYVPLVSKVHLLSCSMMIVVESRIISYTSCQSRVTLLSVKVELMLEIWKKISLIYSFSRII